LRDDDVGAFMCEGWDIGAFTRGMTICGAFMCERWDIVAVRLWCIYLSDDDFGAFMCEG